MWDDSGKAVIAALAQLTRNSVWEVTAEASLDFPSFHTQGITRAGDRLFMSSVEITQDPERFREPAEGFDRGPGAGTAHLFELDSSGHLIRQLSLGEGTIYHPGGIDFDHHGNLWVPVAEYRPGSRAIVYRVDVQSMTSTEMFRFPDHLGGAVYDHGMNALHAVTWGSRQLLTLSAGGAVLNRVNNASLLVDFQGCVTVHDGAMVCTGVTEYQAGIGEVFQLGSATVIDVATGYIRLEVPVTARSPRGRVYTYNAVHFESNGDRLRLIAAEDGLADGLGRLITLETSLR